MPVRRLILMLLGAALGVGMFPQVAEAQRRLLDRARQAAREIVAEEVLPQASALLGDVTALALDDGRFFAVATSWATPDGTGVTSRETLSGSAYVERTGSGFAVLLCDDAEQHRLVSGWTASLPAVRLAERPAAPAAGERARARGDVDDEVVESPFVGDYPLTSNHVRAGVGGRHVRVQGDPEGMLHLTTVSDELWVGTATMSLPSVQFGQESEPRSVQLAMTFRAKPPGAGDSRPACMAQRR